ncbi:hypothetical protein [Rhizobium sp. A37_96]
MMGIGIEIGMALFETASLGSNYALACHARILPRPIRNSNVEENTRYRCTAAIAGIGRGPDR